MHDTQEYPYATYLNVLYPSLSMVDVPSLVESCTDRWYNQTLCEVNDSVVRLGVLQGEFHWHKHDNEDEFLCRRRPLLHRPRGSNGRARAAAGLHRAEGRGASYARARAHRRADGRSEGRGADRRPLAQASLISRSNRPMLTPTPEEQTWHSLRRTPPCSRISSTWSAKSTACSSAGSSRRMKASASRRCRRSSTSAGTSCASAARCASSAAIRSRRTRATPTW